MDEHTNVVEQNISYYFPLKKKKSVQIKIEFPLYMCRVNNSGDAYLVGVVGVAPFGGWIISLLLSPLLNIVLF